VREVVVEKKVHPLGSSRRRRAKQGIEKRGGVKGRGGTKGYQSDAKEMLQLKFGQSD